MISTKLFFTISLFLNLIFIQTNGQSNLKLDEQNNYFNLAYEESSIEPIAPINKTEEVVRANCFCKVSYNNLTNQKTATGVCLDLTSRLNLSFTGLNQQRPKNQRICNDKCTIMAASLTATEIQNIANCACSVPKPTGTALIAYSKIGTRKYRSAHLIGHITNTAAQTETNCTCPPGWTVDNGQSDIKRKCKKAICSTGHPVSNRELPNLPGFVWDNVIYQWIQGNCITNQTSAAVCRLR